MLFSVKKITIKTFCHNSLTHFFSTTAEYICRLTVNYHWWTLIIAVLLIANNTVLASQLPSPTKNSDTLAVQTITEKSSLIALSKQTNLPSSSQPNHSNRL
jgi:hypothetical protein